LISFTSRVLLQRNSQPHQPSYRQPEAIERTQIARDAVLAPGRRQQDGLIAAVVVLVNTR
jgi:hypothetical protein